MVQAALQDSQLTIVELKRKAKPELSCLTRLCVCAADEFMCWHPWLRVMQERKPRRDSDYLFPISVATYTAGLRGLLAHAGVPGAELPSWTSHCARRGSAADVLAAEGPLASAVVGAAAQGHRRGGLACMISHGEWAGRASAAHYVSVDEMDRHAMAQILINGSDSE